MSYIYFIFSYNCLICNSALFSLFHSPFHSLDLLASFHLILVVLVLLLPILTRLLLWVNGVWMTVTVRTVTENGEADDDNVDSDEDDDVDDAGEE